MMNDQMFKKTKFLLNLSLLAGLMIDLYFLIQAFRYLRGSISVFPWIDFWAAAIVMVWYLYFSHKVNQLRLKFLEEEFINGIFNDTRREGLHQKWIDRVMQSE